MITTKFYNDFEQILILIEESRTRAFQKVNEELIRLYFKIGNIVSVKVTEGVWGDNVVDELAIYIGARYPSLKGFSRRGLYRMKQFFETYAAPEFLAGLSSQLKKTEAEIVPIVSTLLSQLPWSSHLHIISKTKSIEEKLFYLQYAISEKWSVRDLERQLNSAIFERTVIANQKVSTLSTQLPQNFF